MNTGNVVFGTLAGFAVGAIAGLLLAPEKGSATRSKIIDMGDGYVDDLKSKFDEFADSLTERIESTMNGSNDFAEKGKAQYDGAKRDVKHATSEVKRSVS